MTDELLPALPEPVEDVYGVMPSGSLDYHKAARDYFTDDQLRAYAREAIRLVLSEAPEATCRSVSVAEGHHHETSHFDLAQPRPHTSRGNGWLGKRVRLVEIKPAGEVA